MATCSLRRVQENDSTVWGHPGMGMLASKNKSSRSCWALFLKKIWIWLGVEFPTAIKCYVYFKRGGCSGGQAGAAGAVGFNIYHISPLEVITCSWGQCFAAAERSRPSRWPSNPLLKFINGRKTLSECKDWNSLETM